MLVQWSLTRMLSQILAVNSFHENIQVTLCENKAAKLLNQSFRRSFFFFFLANKRLFTGKESQKGPNKIYVVYQNTLDFEMFSVKCLKLLKIFDQYLKYLNSEKIPQRDNFIEPENPNNQLHRLALASRGKQQQSQVSISMLAISVLLNVCTTLLMFLVDETLH